jgi:hypothetical protein
MINNNQYNLKKIIISIINHLGKNPKNGGSPPKDKRGKQIINFCVIFFVKNENI